MSRDCFVALPCGAMGLFAVCDCAMTWSYSLTTVELRIVFCIPNQNLRRAAETKKAVVV